MPFRFLAAVVLLAPLAQSAELDDLLDKVVDYITIYKQDFVGVVAEETYSQWIDVPNANRMERVTLKSDVLLVRAPSADRWIQFRDVFEVNGGRVRDRDDRLTKLFLQSSASAQKQLDDIAAASARYNLGSVNRNINLPTFALLVLEIENRPWFSFEARRKGASWELEFREQRTGTLIRTTGQAPMPIRGKFVADPKGRIVASTLTAENDTLKAQIDVTYGDEAAVGVLVPREMREKYVPKVGVTIEGRATYGKFRRYQVKVDETIKK